MSLSTASEGAQTLYIYVMWKWDESGVLLIVSTMTMGIISTQKNQNFWLTDKSPKFWHKAERGDVGILFYFLAQAYKRIDEQSLKKKMEQFLFRLPKLESHGKKHVFAQNWYDKILLHPGREFIQHSIPITFHCTKKHFGQFFYLKKSPVQLLASQFD